MKISSLNFTSIITVFFLFASSAYGITLEECKALALRNSSLLHAYENLINSAIATNREDKSSLFPQITATYQPEHLWYGPDAGFSRQGTRQNVGTTASFDIPRIFANYPQLSQLQVEKSKLIKMIARNELLREVTQEYYGLYIFMQKKDDYKNAHSYIAMHINDIKDLQGRGVDVKLDLLRANLQLNSLYVSISTTNQEIANVLLSLNSLMNTEFNEENFMDMDAPDMVYLQTDHHIYDPVVFESDPRNSYMLGVKNSLLNNLDTLNQTKLNALDVETAKEQYRQNKYNYLPSLEFGYDHNFHTIDPSVETDRVFLALKLNVFDFGVKSNAAQSLKYNYQSQKDMFDENQRKLRVYIQQLITEIESIQVTYVDTNENVQSAKQVIYTAQEYYQEGKIKETDLLSIFSEYINAKDQYYVILYNFFSKKALLDSVVAGIDSDQIN